MYLIAFLTIAIHGCYLGSKVVMSLLALELGGSQFLIGVLASFYAVMPLLLGVFAGRLADSIGTRVPLLAGSTLAGVAMLIGYFWQAIPVLFAVAILMGAAFMLFNVAVQSLAGFYGKPEDRARNLSILTISYSISTFVGPMVAGFTIDHAGHAQAFLAFALITLGPIALLVFHAGITRVSIPRSEKQDKRALDLLRHPPLRRVIVMSGLMVAAWELFGFYMPVFGHSIGLSASTIGVVMGIYAVATFLTRFFLPLFLRRIRQEQALSFFMLLAACGFLLLPFLGHAYAIMVIAFAIGFGMGVAQPISMAMAFERSPVGRAGEVTGLRLTANNVARIVIPLTAGSLGTLFGVAPVFWLNAITLMAISWLAKR